MLRAARRGDGDAWAQLYDDLAGPLLGYLRGQGAPEPEDTMADVFLQVVRGLPRFSGDERGFRAWVFTIAHRRLTDARRRRGRRSVEPTDPVELAAAPLSHAVDAAATADPADLAASGTAEVLDLLDQLTPDQREVLLLRLVAGMTTSEVAAATGRTTEAVKALSKRGIARLRALLGVTEGDAPRAGGTQRPEHLPVPPPGTATER